MPRYAGLSPRQATALSRQAFSDFPGLVVILKPLFRFLPLTEHTVPDGALLIVCGPRGQKPWVTLDDADEYPAFYVRVMEKFARFLPSPEDLDDDLDWADSEPLPIPNAVEEKIRLLKRS